jgi:predicted DNA-binding transcriptional regulator AlpA
MPETYLSDTEIAKRYGIARPTVWRWHRERAEFPRAIRLTPGCTRWKMSDIVAWETAQAEVAA